MIKNKSIVDGITRCSYDSSNVIASAYNEKNKQLSIVFKKGVQYLYENVSFDEYQMLETAKSQGSIFRTVVKDKEFEKGDDIDMPSLLLEIKSPAKGVSVKTELDKDEIQLVSIMKNFLIKHERKSDLILNDIKDVQYFLTKVIKNKENF